MEEAGFRKVEIRSVTKALLVGSTGEFRDNMIKGSAPMQIVKKGPGEALWREKKALAQVWLAVTLSTPKGPPTSDARRGIGRR